jgi:hypothetical protein
LYLPLSQSGFQKARPGNDAIYSHPVIERLASRVYLLPLPHAPGICSPIPLSFSTTSSKVLAASGGAPHVRSRLEPALTIPERSSLGDWQRTLNHTKLGRIMPSLTPSSPLPMRSARTPAERMRLFRRRRKFRRQVVKVEVDPGEVEALIDRGYLPPKDRDDLEVLAAAVTAFFSDALITP